MGASDSRPEMLATAVRSYNLDAARNLLKGNVSLKGGSCSDLLLFVCADSNRSFSDQTKADMARLLLDHDACPFRWDGRCYVCLSELAIRAGNFKVAAVIDWCVKYDEWI